MALGSAFQKVNFLRDLKADLEGLKIIFSQGQSKRVYSFTDKRKIIQEIDDDFRMGLSGIFRLPNRSTVWSIYSL